MKYLAFILFIVVFSSCNSNPEELAKEYCRCRADIEKNKKTEKDCEEMAESHFMRLQDSDDGLAIYSSKIIECLGSSEINTKK